MLSKGLVVLGIAAGFAGGFCGCQSAAVSRHITLAQPLTLDTAAQQRADALAAYGQAQLDELNRDQAAALAHYQEAARFDPDNEDLQLKVALGLLQRQNNQEALAILERLARRHPRSEQALSWLAQVYQSMGRGQEAIRTYERLIRLTPQQASGYLKLAASCSRQGREADALLWLERGLARATAKPELCKALADWYTRRASAAGRPDEARRNRQRALELMEQACRAAPGDNALKTGLAELYLADEQFAKALDLYQAIESRAPQQRLTLRTKLAQSLTAPHRIGPAVAALEKLAAQRPQDERVWYFLGELHETAGRPEQARSCFQRAVDAATHPTAANRLALWYLQHKEPDAAGPVLEAGLRRWPNDPELLQARAYWLLARKAYVQALALFQQALKQNKARPAASLPPTIYIQCAAAALQAGQADEAAELLVQAYAQDNDALAGFCQQTLTGADPAGLRRTAQVFQKIAAKRPNDPQPLILLGYLHHAAKDYAAALQALDQAQTLAAQAAHQSAPLDAAFYFLFGSACERQGQFERAERLFLQCLEQDPEYAEALNYLAYMWSEKGRHLDRALPFIQKALELEPNNGAYLDTLGWVYYQLGRYREALAPLKKAAELVPDDATVYDHLGDLYLKLDDRPQAIRCWTAAYQIDTSNAALAQKLRAQGLDPSRLPPARPPAPAPKPAAPRSERGTLDGTGGAKEMRRPTAWPPYLCGKSEARSTKPETNPNTENPKFSSPLRPVLFFAIFALKIGGRRLTRMRQT